MAVDKFAKFVTAKLAQLKLTKPGHPPTSNLIGHVKTLIRRHVSACNATGTAVDNIDRVIIEAVEDYRLTQMHGKKTSVRYVDPTPKPTRPGDALPPVRVPARFKQIGGSECLTHLKRHTQS